MGKMNKYCLVAIVLITVLLTSCGSQPANGYITPQQISEPTIAEITPIFENQNERVNNCDGANPTYVVSYKTIEAQKATFEVSVGAGGLISGTPIPTVLEVQLEAKIAAALSKDYGITTEKNHEITLSNPDGTYLEHMITWKVTKVKGLIDVIYGDGVAQVSFDKIASVELYDRVSTSISCSQSSAPSTVAPIPQSTPTITNIISPDYVSISLDSLANYAMENLARPLSGDYTFNGIPFSLLAGSKSVFHTQDHVYTSLPTTGSVNLSVVGAKNVYILINGDYVFKSLSGQTVGQITLYFSDGSIVQTNLVAGVNIRENWAYDSGITVGYLNGIATEVITSVSGEGWSSAYNESQSRGGKSATGFIDMITIEIPSSKNALELTKITIDDISSSASPALWVYGITVGTK